jgi:Tat protein secretion system quality control protein TatD with DNase activity
MIIDTHVHLDHRDFGGDLNAVIGRERAAVLPQRRRV